MIHRCLLALLALSASALAQTPPPDGPNDPQAAQEAKLAVAGASFDPAAPDQLEVKRSERGLLLVRPTINNHRAGWFIFDTGAGICVVSKPHAADFNLTRAGEIEGSGVGGSASLPLHRAQTLTLGRLTLRDCPLMETDLSFLTPLLGDEIEGIIGYEVLSRAIVEIDLGGPDAPPRIALLDPATHTLQHGAWQELTVRDRIPSVRAKVEDHQGLFRLDLGANTAITIHEPSVRTWNLLEGRETKDAKLGGVGGFVKAKSATLTSVELAGVKRENVQATFAIEPKGNFADATHDGTIGVELLRPFHIVLDYARSRAAFVTRPPTPAPHQPK